MNPLLLYGFLNMNKYLFLLLIILSNCGTIKTSDELKKNYLKASNLFNETVELELKNKITIITFIDEPSCTGCKEYLAKFLNTLGKKYNQYIILKKSNNVLNKKSYNLYLQNRFKLNSGTYYSLNKEKLSIEINDKKHEFNYQKNPFVAVITTKSSKVDMYDYHTIFENVFVKKSFIKSIKKY